MIRKLLRLSVAFAALAVMVLPASAQRDIRDIFRSGKREDVRKETERQEVMLTVEANRIRAKLRQMDREKDETGRNPIYTWETYRDGSEIKFIREREQRGKNLVATREYFFKRGKLFAFFEERDESVPVFGRRDARKEKLEQRFFLDEDGRLVASHRTLNGRASTMSGSDVSYFTRRGLDFFKK
ncbi:MAG: hypothetical protein M9921_11030 [Fimbriimonadaceae bacterium]|nr:hypothetical protein [Chthonomonadaceae bacterium]MCO5297381.1 hypothetical protein [Fimbriimonadaceae bacterium]